LLSWVDSSFSAHGEQRVPAEDGQGAERLARYLTLGPVALDAVARTERGELRAHTPPDPRTSLPDRVLNPLDSIHAITNQIPNPRQHLVR